MRCRTTSSFTLPSPNRLLRYFNADTLGPCLGQVQVIQSLARPLVGGLQQLQSLAQVAFGTHDAGLRSQFMHQCFSAAYNSCVVSNTRSGNVAAGCKAFTAAYCADLPYCVSGAPPHFTGCD